MRQIETEDASVKRATTLVRRDEKIANAQAEVAKQLKTECEADLAEALPALDEAIGAILYFFIVQSCFFLSLLAKFRDSKIIRKISGNPKNNSYAFMKAVRNFVRLFSRRVSYFVFAPSKFRDS